MTETAIEQEEEQAPVKNRAVAFVNFEIPLKDDPDTGEPRVLKSSKGYAIFDTEAYPINKSDAILVKAAKAALAKGDKVCEIQATLRIVLNSDIADTADEFDLDSLPE